jgi:Ca-activated chloride channel family protein
MFMRLLVIIILASIAIEVYPQTDRKLIRKGNSDYKDGNYPQAEVEYRKALEKDTLSFRADYNLGNALYRQKQYDAAAERYTGLAVREKDKQKLSRFYYNLGNAMYEKQKYKESIEAYKNALRNNPGDMDTKHNLQLALKMLNDKKQQQNQNNQQQNKEQQDQKNKENQDKQNNGQQDKQNNEKQQGQKNENTKPSGQSQSTKGQISPEDAERILQALENEEKDVMKKVQEKKEHGQKVQVDKNW